ncbi:USH1C [Acanthosepion pharaonis]|uniref:USH1C n=1 Tax=Acanthosepion pharaonis TaxID=158019 RepID=A0A812B3V5_ACAPH|nr:USH1C [Sepia pharaonis]
MIWDEELESDLLSEVKAFIPQEYEQEILFDALRKYQKSLDLPTLMSDLKTVINGPERILLYEEIRPLIPLKQQMDYDSLCPVLPSDTLKVIRLQRYGNESLGFAVRGGLEHGIGMFVSQVSQQSQAYQKGLRKGDEIIRVNGFTISEAIHEEVLSLIKARNEIVLKIRRIVFLSLILSPSFFSLLSIFLSFFRFLSLSLAFYFDPLLSISNTIPFFLSPSLTLLLTFFALQSLPNTLSYYYYSLSQTSSLYFFLLFTLSNTCSPIFPTSISL